MNANDNSSYINFQNEAQVILYECELKGQLSDGHWENAVPHNHWQTMCRAAAIANPISPLGCVRVWPRRRYAFHNKDLVECIGDRMINFVKTYKAFPGLEFDKHWTYDVSDDATDKEPVGEYFIQKRKELLEDTGCATVHEFLSLRNAIQYTLKDLKADLKAMSMIVNGDAHKLPTRAL